INGQRVTTTDEHPFMVAGLGWIAARDLRAGDLLVTAADPTTPTATVRLDAVDIERADRAGAGETDSDVTVYNVHVHAHHSYYVLAGDTAVLVHNMGTHGARGLGEIRPTPMHYAKPGTKASRAYEYQRAHTGMFEFKVTGGGESVWADGIDGTTLVDAKYIETPSSSPYTGTAPDFVNASTIDEMRRYGAVIADDATSFESLRIVTNHPAGVEYFRGMLDDLGIPATVVLSP
ncbi:Hint domain-containing protein, partial [Luteimicrobium subarcticum]